MAGLLDTIHGPEDLKKIPRKDLPVLAKEVRELIIDVVSKNGGHLSSNLGVVELTIALLYVMNLPKDCLIWDVGHQCYTHKILTGRRDRFETLRKFNGLSGFPKVEESPYDFFNTGHSGTSISAALGIARARKMRSEDGLVIAVIGDGSMTTGLSFEGLNQAGHFNDRFLVILNDNELSIGPNVGALSSYFGRIITGQVYNRMKADVEQFLQNVPRIGRRLIELMRKGQESIKGLLGPGMLFEELGFKYVGPVDGHNFKHLIETLENVKTIIKEPTFLHVVTKKGRGYEPAEKDPETFHGIGPFDKKTGAVLVQANEPPTYTQVFGDALVRLAEKDTRIVAITAAMTCGTGLKEFKARFPDRFFDVGIAEEHAVTFASGLASKGFVPFVTIYSTFLQRAFDEICHDVCLMGHHVVFCLDRAGLVGEDGPTHHGAFDLSYLRIFPGMTIMSPANGNELVRMMRTAIALNGPVAIRYPRGKSPAVAIDWAMPPLEVGKGEVLREGSDIAIFAIGRVVVEALRASEILASRGISVAVVNARFAKPLDTSLIREMALKTGFIVACEENSIQGGFGSAVFEALAELDLPNVRARSIGLPDEFIEHGGVKELSRVAGIDAESIAYSCAMLLENGKKIAVQ
jgi:1-deoxy-D-xylulose-5-phosphate synthase